MFETETIVDHVERWIKQARPGAFVFRDQETVLRHVHGIFASAGGPCEFDEFRDILRFLGYEVTSHPGGYRLVLDSRLA